MSETLSEWLFVSFTAWPKSMYSLICFLYSFANSGFFANLFANDLNLFSVGVRLLGSFRDSLFLSKGVSKWPFFNIVLFSKICKACCSVGDSKLDPTLKRFHMIQFSKNVQSLTTHLTCW